MIAQASNSLEAATLTKSTDQIVMERNPRVGRPCNKGAADISSSTKQPRQSYEGKQHGQGYSVSKEPKVAHVRGGSYPNVE